MRLSASKLAGLAMALSFAASVATPAQAGVVYGFTKITNNGNTDVASQLSVEVIDSGMGMVSFLFANSGPIGSGITQALFDDNLSLFDATTVVITDNPPTIDFTVENNPTLPGGNNVSPAFVGDYGIENDGGFGTSVGPGESVTVKYTLNGSFTYANVLTAISTGAFRMGLHVQGIQPQGGSDSYVNIPRPDTIPVPEPSSVILGLVGVGLLGASAARRRLAKKA